MLKNKINKSFSKKYPLEIEDIDDLEIGKRQIINKILYLFVYFAGKGSKHNYKDLQEKYFIQMMCEVWVESGKQPEKYKREWNDIYMLFYTKGSKKSLNFAQFLELIPTLSYHFEPQMKKEDCLKSLLSHFIKVYEKKIENELRGKVVDISLHINESTYQFILKLIKDLSKVYKSYFPHETCNKFRSNELKFRELSLHQFMQFMKDFQVFPRLISAKELFYIFQESCNSKGQRLQGYSAVKQIGEHFTLEKFVQSLIRVSMRTYSKLKQIDEKSEKVYEQKEMLKTLLEYMQTVKTTKKGRKPLIFSQLRFSFIVLEEHNEENKFKTVLVKDKVIRESTSEMDFYSLIKKMKL